MSTSVTNTAAAAAAATAATATATGSSTITMGKDDFLKMMIAELQNQDPLNPMDGTQYASQLAQFSSLEQLSNLNTTMTQSVSANANLTQSITNSLAANLIGKDVRVNDSNITVNGQSSMTLGYNLASNAKTVDVKILDSNGAVVKTISGASSNSGDNKLSWDMTDDNGNKLANGSYSFEVDAVDESGAAMTPTLFRLGTITGVKFTSSGTNVVVDGADYPISDITEVDNSGSTGGN
jgi:flagellar basal-body rod modification protein FlgD